MIGEFDLLTVIFIVVHLSHKYTQIFWELTASFKWKLIIFYFSCYIEVKNWSQSVCDLEVVVMISAILANENVIEVRPQNKFFRLSDLLENMGTATYWNLLTYLFYCHIIVGEVIEKNWFNYFLCFSVSKNKIRSWLWLRSWTPYCQTQT